MRSRLPPRSIALSFLAAGLFACGGGGGNPAAPEGGASSRTVQGRVVDLFGGGGIGGATVEVDGRAVTSQTDGSFSVATSSSASLLPVRVSAAGYHTRETFVVGSGATLEVAPASFDMTAFDDVGRERGERTVRWVSDPVVYVDTRGREVAAGDAALAAWVAEVREALPGLIAEWTDGQLRAADVVVGPSPADPGTRGTIVVSFDERPGAYENERQAGYARTWQGADRVVVGAHVQLRFSGLTGSSGALSRKAVLAHEIGHALGFSHMDGSVSSIMTAVIRTPVRTSFDRLAGSLLYHRPPGNTRLDKDSASGYRAGLGASAAVRVEEWACAADGVDLDL